MNFEQKKIGLLLSLWVWSFSAIPTVYAQTGFDKIYSFSPAPTTSIYSGIRSVYADSQSIFVLGETFRDSTLNNGFDNYASFLGAFDYSGHLQWEKKLIFQPTFFRSTQPNFFHLIGKVGSDKYVVGAQGWDLTSVDNAATPRPFLYFFNSNGDSLGFSAIPFGQPESANFLYSAMVDKQRNIVATGRYWDDTWNTDSFGLWMAKLDASGNFLWRKEIYNQAGNRYWAEAYKVINSTDGLHYLIGGRASHPDLSTNTWFAVWKTDTAGNVVWQKNIPKATSTVDIAALGDQYFDIIPAIDGSGYYFLAVDLIPIQLPDGMESVTTVYYCGKLDEDGNILWGKTYQRDDTYFEKVFGLAQKPNGDLLFMGISISYLPAEEASSGPSLFCTDSLGNLKWFKITKRYQCPYEIRQFLWGMSVTPNGGVVRGGWISQDEIQPGCYDSTDVIAWLVLADSLGRRSLDDTVTYPMDVKDVVYDSTSVIHLSDEITWNIQLFPNPTKDIVYVALLGLREDPKGISIRLYDYTGRLLQQKKMHTVRQAIDLSRYAPGAYFIRLHYDNKDIGGGKVIRQ